MKACRSCGDTRFPLARGRCADGCALPSLRKPFNNKAGYVASRRSGPVGPDGKRGWVVIYEAEAQGIDTDGDRYAVVCETHATILAEPTLRGARLSIKDPAQFCEDCRNGRCPWCGTRYSHEEVCGSYRYGCGSQVIPGAEPEDRLQGGRCLRNEIAALKATGGES